MGLFGASKFEQAQHYIDDVEVFYERMLEIFKKNINTRHIGISQTHMQNIYIRSPIFALSHFGSIGREQKEDQFFFKDVEKLFSIYPVPIAGDHETVKNYWLQGMHNRMGNHYYRNKYDFPFAWVDDANNYKTHTLLVLKHGSFYEIDKICKDFFEILDNAFNKANDYKRSFFNNDYQKLYLRLLPIYYRGKGAVIWFNYLNKIEE